MSKIRSEQILENEIVGMRNGIPEEETKNKYGDAARVIEVEKLENGGIPREFCLRKYRKGGNNRK